VTAEAQPTDADVVLIHGLWMTPLSWEHWIDRYESRGYRTIAPSWPGMEGSVDDLRRDPSRIAELDVETVIDHYASIIAAMERQPIVMGHSFGGTFVQLLLDRGLGAAGVGIGSSSVKGILDLPLSTVRSASPVLANPFNRNKATLLSEKQFKYAFGNTLDEDESRAAYERYHVPAANRVLFQGALANFSRKAPLKVDFRKDDRAPLLLIAGGADHVIPAKVNRHNVDKYKHSQAVTEYKEFPGRSHFTVGEPGWEEVADYALDWAVEHARQAARA
jgi:alpha-beta hydrolase superfamily lysophospholipase